MSQRKTLCNGKFWSVVYKPRSNHWSFGFIQMHVASDRVLELTKGKSVRCVYLSFGPIEFRYIPVMRCA